MERAHIATRRKLKLFRSAHEVALKLRLGQIISVNGTGELTGEGVATGRVRATGQGPESAR
jgi:hypothetical protein